jgi:hypothetical protein
MRRKVRINFSDFWHGDTLEAKQQGLLFQLLSKRFDLEICERPDFLLFSVFGVDFIRYNCTRIFYTGENIRPNYSLCDWAFSFDYSDDPRHMRMPYYFFVDLNSLGGPKDVEALFAEKTGFCSFVVSSPKCKPRLELFDKLSRYKKVDSGGKLRNNVGFRVPDKHAFLRSHKFNIAFENVSYPGYITEKIAEAFKANTVPIYWGNTLVSREFNTDAFINCHDFRSLDDVVEFIVELDRNDALYKKYLGASFFPDGKPTIYVDEQRILDRFEQIFSAPLARPVAQTVRGKLANLLREPRRRRRSRRAMVKPQ